MYAFTLQSCAIVAFFLVGNSHVVAGDRIEEFVELSRPNQQDSEARRRIPKDYFDFVVNDTDESAPTDFYAGLPENPVRCGSGGHVFSIAAENSAPVIAALTIKMPKKCVPSTLVQPLIRDGGNITLFRYAVENGTCDWGWAPFFSVSDKGAVLHNGPVVPKDMSLILRVVDPAYPSVKMSLNVRYWAEEDDEEAAFIRLDLQSSRANRSLMVVHKPASMDAAVAYCADYGAYLVTLDAAAYLHLAGKVTDLAWTDYAYIDSDQDQASSPANMRQCTFESPSFAATISFLIDERYQCACVAARVDQASLPDDVFEVYEHVPCEMPHQFVCEM